MNRKFIEFIPFYENKIWGGKKFKTILGRNPQNTQPLGETREVSDNDFLTSVVCDGKFQGKTLSELMNNHSQYVMGESWEKGKNFPLIIKWIDSNQSSSIQVHPNKDYAKKHKIYEKNEAWFFYQTDANSKIILGLNDKVELEKLFNSKDNAEIMSQLNEVEVEEGDFVYVPSGCVHAIGDGCLILEIQQNSNTTFRIYDWNRQASRELHKKESLQNISVKPKAIHLKTSSDMVRHTLKSEHFDVIEYKLKAGDLLEIKAYEQPRLLSLIKGDVEDSISDTKIDLLSTVLLPYAEGFKFKINTDCHLLITENFI